METGYPAPSSGSHQSSGLATDPIRFLRFPVRGLKTLSSLVLRLAESQRQPLHHALCTASGVTLESQGCSEVRGCCLWTLSCLELPWTSQAPMDDRPMLGDRRRGPTVCPPPTPELYQADQPRDRKCALSSPPPETPAASAAIHTVPAHRDLPFLTLSAPLFTLHETVLKRFSSTKWPLSLLQVIQRCKITCSPHPLCTDHLQLPP